MTAAGDLTPQRMGETSAAGLPRNPTGTDAATGQPRRRGPAPKPVNHGTPGGYQTHRSRGEEPCALCRQAISAYNRDLKATSPMHRERTKRRSAARWRALRRLAAEYPQRLEELIREEMARV